MLVRFFFSGPRFFCAYRLSPRRSLSALSAPSAFNNYVLKSYHFHPARYIHPFFSVKT
ncbi:hypothetical protein Hanom_Chr05g00434321 [Helianthus anomalus]